MRPRLVLALLAALLLVVAAGAQAQVTVVNFDSLSGRGSVPSGYGGSGYWVMDDVTYGTSSTPEPCSLLCLGVGGGIAALVRRHRQRKA